LAIGIWPSPAQPNFSPFFNPEAVRAPDGVQSGGRGDDVLPLAAREHAGFRAMHQRFIRRHAVAEIEADVAILADTERETFRRILVFLRNEALQFFQIPRAPV
jgi:hypothetical protein